MFFSSLKVIMTTESLTTVQKYQFLQNCYICVVQQTSKLLFKQPLFVGLTFIIGAALYAKFMFYGHISWDDPEMVFKNKAVHNFDIKTLLTSHYVGNYIPLTMLLHACVWQLFGDVNWGHHLVGICLHLVNGWLVYSLGQKLFKNGFVAGMGLVVFLLHPLQVESVVWISELKNALSTSFYLLAIHAYLVFSQKTAPLTYILLLLWFLCALLSKSSAVVLPLMCLSIDLITHRKFRIKQFIYLLPLFVLAILFGYINIKTQTADLFINHAHAFPLYQRIGNAGFAILQYIGLYLAPVQLSVIYPFPKAVIQVWLLGYLMWAVIGVALYVGYKKKSDGVLLSLAMIVVNLILVLQFVPFGEVLYADRYMYIPLIGFAWLTGVLLKDISPPTNLSMLVLCAVLGLLTLKSGDRWQSTIHLYEDILTQYPDEFIALNSAGVECMFNNEDKKALDYFNQATRVAPYNYKGFYNRGLLYLKNNQPKEAIATLNQSLKLFDYNKAFTARASAYYMLGDYSKALEDAQRSLSLDAKNAKAHFVMGNCYNDMNRLNDALREYNKSLELDGDDADCYFKRAIVYGKNQEFKASVNDLSTCIELRPVYYEAYYWRGVAKINLGVDGCDDLRIAALRNFKPAVAAFNKYCR